MLRSDKFLMGIVIAVVALIAVGFFVALRQQPPTYRADDTADAVAYNYLVALQNGDYERAYDVLATSVPGRPDTIEAFVDDVVERLGGSTYSGSGTSSYRIDSTDLAGERAVVTVIESSFRSSGLFDSGSYTDDFEVMLAIESGEWKVQHVAEWRYWHNCWTEPEESYCQRRTGDDTDDSGQVAP